MTLKAIHPIKNPSLHIYIKKRQHSQGIFTQPVPQIHAASHPDF